MAGISCFMHSHTPVSVTPSARSQSSRRISVSRRKPAPRAALFAAQCRAPKASTVARTIASTCASSATSARTQIARPPAASTSRTVSSPPAASTSATVTAAPSRAKPSAVARPMPAPPPVTSATLPSRSPTPPPRAPAAYHRPPLLPAALREDAALPAARDRLVEADLAAVAALVGVEEVLAVARAGLDRDLEGFALPAVWERDHHVGHQRDRPALARLRALPERRLEQREGFRRSGERDVAARCQALHAPVRGDEEGEGVEAALVRERGARHGDRVLDQDPRVPRRLGRDRLRGAPGQGGAGDQAEREGEAGAGPAHAPPPRGAASPCARISSTRRASLRLGSRSLASPTRKPSRVTIAQRVRSAGSWWAATSPRRRAASKRPSTARKRAVPAHSAVRRSRTSSDLISRRSRGETARAAAKRPSTSESSIWASVAASASRERIALAMRLAAPRWSSSSTSSLVGKWA